MSVTSLATLAQYDSNHILMSTVNDETYSPTEKQFFLDQATAYIESQCYMPLRLQEYIETLRLGNLYCSVDEYGWLNIFPKNFPLVDVEEVAYRLTPSGTFIVIDPTNYSVADPRVITVPFVSPFVPRMFGEVRVTYEAGYADDAIPDDLVFACCVVAAVFMSAGYAAVTPDGNLRASLVVPAALFGPDTSVRQSMVAATINKYQRQF